MPQVQVTQNPVAVVLIVGLICVAVIVALIFAGPWTTRVPRAPRVPPRPTGDNPGPPAPSDTLPEEPTGSSAEPAWASTRQTPPGHD